jgi:hypothetical protein
VHVLADINGYYAGHDHDDRYYTEAEVDAGRVVTEAFSPFNMRFIGTANTSTFNNCPTRPSGGGGGTLGLDIPVGARIDTITASVLDDSSTTIYSLSATLFRLTTAGMTVAAVASGSGGASTSATIATVDLSPSTAPHVVIGDTLVITFQTTAVNTNGLCGVTVQYTLPSL